MDTSEHVEIQEAKHLGHPQTDEGPYYHDSWWESYKGSVKGKLGGAVIGAGMGAAIGVAAVIAIPLVGGALLTASALAMTVSGFAAAGMMYGAHQFENVGAVTGAVAAGLETAERRQDVKLASLENKLDKLQATITGQPVPEETKPEAEKTQAEKDASLDYKTTHCDDHASVEEKPRIIFWKVALVGLAIGAAAGLLLASGGIAGHVLAALGAAGEGGVLSTVGVYAASMLTMGLFGASFGVNRDIFRDVFDRTDLMFRGIVGQGKKPDPVAGMVEYKATEKTPEKAAEKTAEQPAASAPSQEAQPQEPVNVVIPQEKQSDSQVKYPESQTYHRDKVMASARNALLSMDHTKSIPH